MRSALIIGVSVLALSLGGCSWFERTTGIGGGDQSASEAQPAPPAQNSSQAASNTPAPAPAPAAQTSGSGSTAHHHPMHASNEVRMAQEKLKDDGDYMGKIDGLAGPQTHQAVMQYQKKNGLKQTGYLDHATLSKLGVGHGSAASSGSTMPPASSNGGGSSMPPAASNGGATGGGNPSSGPAPAPAPAPGNSGGDSH
jgi:peptidoglycan hydrolase-like protein with peptidoglycan-binding domain